MAKRQILIVQTAADLAQSAGTTPPPENDSQDNELVAIGPLNDVLAALSNHNIAPDTQGGEFLYGPGLTIQIPLAPDSDVMQVLCSLIDEDIAWPVLFRMCKQRHWSMMDPESGRILHISADATM